jgi:hypothetical protein
MLQVLNQRARASFFFSRLSNKAEWVATLYIYIFDALFFFSQYCIANKHYSVIWYKVICVRWSCRNHVLKQDIYLHFFDFSPWITIYNLFFPLCFIIKAGISSVLNVTFSPLKYLILLWRNSNRYFLLWYWWSNLNFEHTDWLISQNEIKKSKNR